MIASSSTFRPYLGRVIRDLFRLLDAVYGIVRKHKSTAIIQGQLQPPRIWPVAYPGSSAQQRSQCSTRISAGADVGRGSLK